MPDLILLRHGQSLWNELNLFTGWHDVPLTERGRAEAAAAGVLWPANPAALTPFALLAPAACALAAASMVGRLAASEAARAVSVVAAIPPDEFTLRAALTPSAAPPPFSTPSET